MKKLGLIVGILIATVLIGCSDLSKNVDRNGTPNPLATLDTEERIVLSLEKTYPGHKFKVLKKLDTYDGEYYSLCEDENGLKFKVDYISFNSLYHFSCEDEYIREILFKQDFLGKAKKIAKREGYRVKYDSDNEMISLEVDFNNGDVDIENVAKTVCEIVNIAKGIPKYHTEDMTFSTRELKYVTLPKMHRFACDFYFEDKYLNSFTVGFSNEEVEVEEVLLKVEEGLKGAKRVKQTIDEKRGN